MIEADADVGAVLDVGEADPPRVFRHLAGPEQVLEGDERFDFEVPIERFEDGVADEVAPAVPEERTENSFVVLVGVRSGDAHHEDVRLAGANLHFREDDGHLLLDLDLLGNQDGNGGFLATADVRSGLFGRNWKL